MVTFSSKVRRQRHIALVLVGGGGGLNRILASPISLCLLDEVGGGGRGEGRGGRGNGQAEDETRLALLCRRFSLNCNTVKSVDRWNQSYYVGIQTDKKKIQI
jgi:hypothetical protein